MLAHAAHTLAAPNDDDERSDEADAEEAADEEADGSSACEAASGAGGASSSTPVPTQLEHSVWPQIGQRTLYGPSMPNEALNQKDGGRVDQRRETKTKKRNPRTIATCQYIDSMRKALKNTTNKVDACKCKRQMQEANARGKCKRRMQEAKRTRNRGTR